MERNIVAIFSTYSIINDLQDFKIKILNSFLINNYIVTIILCICFCEGKQTKHVYLIMGQPEDEQIPEDS